jgi:3-oxoacyl-[acyl-carrier protein] reductase
VALAPNLAVNCIAPGLIENTRIAKNLPDEIVQANLSQAGLGKLGSVDDIATQVVLFCKADTITGQMMIVDGGVSARMR